VLLSPRPEYFNLDAKSEGLSVPKSDKPPDGDAGGRGRITPIKHIAGVEQAKRRRRAYGATLPSTVSSFRYDGDSCEVQSGVSAWPRGEATKAKRSTSPIRLTVVVRLAD
jgi:hypothetical protein